MTKFFGNLWAVLAVGALLAAGMLFGHMGGINQTTLKGFLTFLHVLCGIMWIGHLYYFNFTQIPTMPSVPAELKPGITKYIAPQALFWFRWGALATVITGLSVSEVSGYTVEALTLQEGYRAIGAGKWFALIMAFNVWFIIWPAQKKALGIVEADADTKAKAGTRAMIFSRTNTLLSIPMLLGMVMQNMGGAF
jgi:uncharacterized membrane protein